MSDNSNNVHFSGVRFICSPYLAIKSALADNRKMRAANECYALKMNIIVIFLTIHYIFCLPALLCAELSRTETKMSIFSDFFNSEVPRMDPSPSLKQGKCSVL